MYDKRFFRTTLGKAAMVSIVAMAGFALLSSHVTLTAPTPPLAFTHIAEIA